MPGQVPEPRWAELTFSLGFSRQREKSQLPVASFTFFYCVSFVTVAEPTKPSHFARNVVRPPTANGRIECSLVVTLKQQYPNSADQTENSTQVLHLVAPRPPEWSHRQRQTATSVCFYLCLSVRSMFSQRSRPSVSLRCRQTTPVTHRKVTKVRGVMSEP